ncbi:MAG: hypothetical protein H6717_14705 [Polyangiaceae bacterium]|nr:hypothetical protein [Polyangiaceae bacterium]
MEILVATAPPSSLDKNIAVFGSKIFFAGSNGIYRANDDGTGEELWVKNACVSKLAVDPALSEVVFYCRYDNTIRVRGANKGPTTDFVYDREIPAHAESGLWIDATHYWYQRIDGASGAFATGEVLRVPKQGGPEEPMLDIANPPLVHLSVGTGGPYALQLVDQTDKHLRLVRLGSSGNHQLLLDWINGYQNSSRFLYVGKTHLVMAPNLDVVRVPL